MGTGQGSMKGRTGVRGAVLALLLGAGSAVMLVTTQGCSALLPHGQSKAVSRWPDFETAKQNYDQIVAYQTREADLEGLGFSPHVQPNVRILNQAEIAEQFLSGSFHQSILPPGLRDCLARHEACYGYQVRQRTTYDQRYGNFFADFLNFKRKTETRGWEFSALIVLVDGQVVYKQWSGTPEIHEYRDQTNPLGPLQGIGPSLTPRPEL